MPSKINIKSLESVPLSDVRALPSLSGVYLAIDGEGKVQYVGRTSNLKDRWKSHRKIFFLREIPGVRVAYLLADRSEIEDLECALVLRYKPPLNIANVSRSHKTFSAEDTSKVFSLKGLVSPEFLNVNKLHRQYGKPNGLSRLAIRKALDGNLYRVTPQGLIALQAIASDLAGRPVEVREILVEGKK